jgi:hypothetical protein
MLYEIKSFGVVRDMRMFIFLESLFHIVCFDFKLVNNINWCITSIKKHNKYLKISVI